MNSFKNSILKTQERLKEIYAKEIERIGGLSIWEEFGKK